MTSGACSLIVAKRWCEDPDSNEGFVFDWSVVPFSVFVWLFRTGGFEKWKITVWKRLICSYGSFLPQCDNKRFWWMNGWIDRSMVERRQLVCWCWCPPETRWLPLVVWFLANLMYSTRSSTTTTHDRQS